MSKAKLVLIGAGSTSFGVNTLADIFQLREQLRGSTVALCDVDAVKLEQITRLAERLNAATGAGMRIECATDYRALLPGAEIVFVSTEVDRLARWKLDWEIPLRYGIRHVLGENGGPGGLAHALRTIELVLGIAREVERLAPDATLINFTNPLSRVCLALTRYTRLRVVGLCHQINKGYYIVGHILGLTPRLADGFPEARTAAALRRKFDLRTAGLNHFTWITELRERGTGRDLYPEFRLRLRDFDPTFEPLSRRLYEAFGLFPTSGDDHVGEYFSYAAETSDLAGYDFQGREQEVNDLSARVDRAAHSDDALAEFAQWDSGERGVQIAVAILNNSLQYEETVNVVNNGAITGLPDWAIVEVPAVVGAQVSPLHIGELPAGITALLNQQVAIQDRVVEAAVHGDRQAALQALLLDPLVGSYAAAQAMLDELLWVNADYLPVFSPSRKA